MTSSDEEQLLELRFREAGNDRDELRRLSDLLLGRKEPWVGKLRLKVGMQLAKAKARPDVAAPGGTAPDFVGRYGISRPDGRWLFAYRLSDTAFEQLQVDVGKAGAAERLNVGSGPALFVLWASEWFRRRYRGDGHSWDKLLAALGCDIEQNALRAITARGLQLWQRKVIADDSGRQFLATLAREGGFPAGAVEDGGRGWAREVLERIVAPLLAAPAPDYEGALALALPLQPRTPLVYRDSEFMALCADLALAIVRLRVEAEVPASALGMPVAAWLEIHRPDWRDSLPITIDRAATALIDGLMAVEADRIGRGEIGVERLLERTPIGWREALRLDLDGSLSGSIVAKLDPVEGRLRAHAAGDLARVLPGEIALIEPPVDGETHWRSRALRRGSKLHAVPFSVPIELDLRAGEHRAGRILVPGGQPRRGRLLVCTVARGTEDSPTELRVEGSGTGNYRADTVIVQGPTAWRIDASLDESVDFIEPGAGDTQLWRVRGGAYVTTPEADRFRIKTGQSADKRERIDLIGTRPGWARVSGDVDMFCGAPHVNLSTPARGGLFLRRIGARDWTRAPRVLPLGHYDLGWRDDRLLLDKRRIAILPLQARLSSSFGRDARFTLTGWDGCRLTPAADAPVASVDETLWRSRPVSKKIFRFTARLHWNGDYVEPLDVIIDYPTEAAIARWNGEILPNGTAITLADLSDLVAIDRGHMQMFAELIEMRRPAPGGVMSWDFDEEMPMSVPAADIASLLMPAHIDATVRLGMHNGVETYWHVSQFAATLEVLAGGLVATKGVVAPGTELCGRALSDAGREVSFGAYSLTDNSNHRPVALPDHLAGTWLVYLRQGEAVLSRPILVHRAEPVEESTTSLGRAMAVTDWNDLNEGLNAALDLAMTDSSNAMATVEELIALTASLRGLPPSTFRVLALLAERPDVLARMALFATNDTDRAAVLALSDALPFAWCVLPKDCWSAARSSVFGHALTLFSQLGDRAAVFAKEMVDRSVHSLTKQEPLLAVSLRPPESAQNIKVITQAFLNRSIERISGSGSIFRKAIGDAAFPAYFKEFDERCLESLDAPCAAALAAAGRWRPEPIHIRRIKAIARNFPTYFAEAYAAFAQEIR